MELPPIHINYPCGRLTSRPGWGRSRANSLNLRDHELWFVWRGRGWMATRSQRFELRPGFCAWMRPGGIYDAGSDARDPLGFTYIHFAGRFLEPPPEFFHVPDVGYMDAVTRRIVDLVEPGPRSQWGMPAAAPSAAAALLRAVLMDLVHQPARYAHRRNNDPLRKHIEALAATLRDCPETPLCVDDEAQRAAVSLPHFSRAFRRITGLSPQQYRLQARLDRARHLLAESNLTVTRVAEMLGYKDLYFFSRHFKRHTGLSPTEYRSSLQR